MKPAVLFQIEVRILEQTCSKNYHVSVHETFFLYPFTNTYYFHQHGSKVNYAAYGKMFNGCEEEYFEPFKTFYSGKYEIYQIII